MTKHRGSPNLTLAVFGGVVAILILVLIILGLSLHR